MTYESSMNYEKVQEKWIKDNNIHVGSKVIVWGKSKMSIGVMWVPEMDNYIGKTFKIREINYNGIRLKHKDEGYIFPFTSLEPVKKSKVKLLNAIKSLENTVLNLTDTINKMNNPVIIEKPICEKEKEVEMFIPEHFKSFEDWWKYIKENTRGDFANDLFGMLNDESVYTHLKLKCIADQLNSDWGVNFKAEEKAWEIHYSIDSEDWVCNYTYTFKTAGAIYFKTEENARKAIELMGNDIRLL